MQIEDFFPLPEEALRHYSKRVPGSGKLKPENERGFALCEVYMRYFAQLISINQPATPEPVFLQKFPLVPEKANLEAQ
jgi:hypothetical protein